MVLCESPVIILNDKFKWCFLSNGYYYQDDRLVCRTRSQNERDYDEFPYYLFSKKKFGITSSNLDYIYTIDAFGEVVPAWIEVPCGKCDICRHKKSSEWSFRAVCETQTSSAIPLFVTLTYNNDHLPSQGVCKDELQRFMKRLRIWFDRHGIEHNIRYFACGEYGSLSGRAHYHLLLWNFPVIDEEAVQGIPFAISAYRIIEPIWDRGFVYVKPSDYGSIFYVMKYMRKGLQAPKFQNSGFFLSSRKDGGIGAAYLQLVKDYYLENPHITKMTVVDKYTGKLFESFIPRYFRDKLFPPASKAVPQNVIKALKLLNYCCLFKRALILTGLPKGSGLSIGDDVIPGLTKNLGTIYKPKDLQIFKKFEHIYHFHEFVESPPSMILLVYHEINLIPFKELVIQCDVLKDILTDYLDKYCFNGSDYLALQSKKEIFMNRLSIEMEDVVLTETEITYIADSYRSQLRSQILREAI